MSRLAFVAILLLAAPAFAADEKEPDIIAKLKKAKVDGPFTLVVTLKVKKGQEKALLAAAAPCIGATRKEKGCVAYELIQDIDDPSRFVFYERWTSTDALAAHLNAEHTKKLVGGLGKLLDGPPDFRAYRGAGK